MSRFIFNTKIVIKRLIVSCLKKLVKNNLKPYDFVFSLGESCFCANALKLCSLRKLSCPFDWISGSTFFSRIDFLKNNFEKFLNIEDLEYCSYRLEPESCDIYKNTRTNMVFNHDFKYNTPIEKSFPDVSRKYTRRIKRLLKILNSKNNVLMIYMESPINSESIASDNNQIIAAIEKLNKKFKANINLLYFEHDNTMKKGEYHHVLLNENISKIILNNEGAVSSELNTCNYHNVSLILQNIST